MRHSLQKESDLDPKQINGHWENTINVTSFLNDDGPKNVKKKIFDLLATGKGKLQISNQTVSLSFLNITDRKRFDAEIQ